MEQSLLMVFAVVGVALASCYVPLVGLVAVAWGSLTWVGVSGALVITLFYVRHGPTVLTWPGWPPRPSP